jgi:hypothetical protein
MVLMVHTMIGIYNLALSLCKSGVGTLSLYTIREVICLSLQFGSCLSTIHNLGFKKMSYHRSPVSRHVLIDMLIDTFMCVREIYVSLNMDFYLYPPHIFPHIVTPTMFPWDKKWWSTQMY